MQCRRALVRFQTELTGFFGELASFLVELSGFFGELASFLVELSGFFGELASFLVELSAFFAEPVSFLVELSAPFAEAVSFPLSLASPRGAGVGMIGTKNPIDRPTEPIYFIEVQFQPDPTFTVQSQDKRIQLLKESNKRSEETITVTQGQIRILLV